jgi:nucleotide-binding universal stress UspA family protein
MKESEQGTNPKPIFNTIFVPITTEEESYRTAHAAFALARQMHISVILLYGLYRSAQDVPYFPIAAYPVPAYPLSASFPVLETDRVKTEQIAAHNILQDLSQVGEEMGVIVKAMVVDGPVDDFILQEVKPKDLIVLKRKGFSTLDRVFLGSISEEVIHKTSCAVLILQPEKKA